MFTLFSRLKNETQKEQISSKGSKLFPLNDPKLRREVKIKWVELPSLQVHFCFRMASFESSTDNEDQYQKYPIRRLEPSIQKFLKVIKIDLGRLHQHKLNIEKVCMAVCNLFNP